MDEGTTNPAAGVEVTATRSYETTDEGGPVEPDEPAEDDAGEDGDKE